MLHRCYTKLKPYDVRIKRQHWCKYMYNAHISSSILTGDKKYKLNKCKNTTEHDNISSHTLGSSTRWQYV